MGPGTLGRPKNETRDPGPLSHVGGTKDLEQLSRSTQNSLCLINLLHAVFTQKNLLFGF